MYLKRVVQGTAELVRGDCHGGEHARLNSDDPSLNLADVNNSSLKLPFEKNENGQEEVGQFKSNHQS